MSQTRTTLQLIRCWKFVHPYSEGSTWKGDYASARCVHGFSERRAEAEERRRHQKDCQVLNVPEDCDQTQARMAFISLAKRYHPDSGTKEANDAKFQRIDSAYKNVVKRLADERTRHRRSAGEYGLYYQEKDQETEQEDEGPDIKHTAPQHRQYLSFDGVGTGTPLQREKQYQKYRAMKAVDNVMEHRMKQVSNNANHAESALVKDQRAAKKIKTGIGMERLVEDLIQESMARGDFDNLAGKGQPLKHDSSYNPYIDFTTHKLNQVLIDNGFTPEWILLEKEIRSEIETLRQRLRKARHKYDAELTPSDLHEWERYLSIDFTKECKTVNRMIEKYNLVVPYSLHKQMMLIQVNREAKKALVHFCPQLRENVKEEMQRIASRNEKVPQGESVLTLLFSMFKF